MTVVSRWSDGDLVAIDGATGLLAWRAAGPSGGTYTGGRTGAATVWSPPGLHTAGELVIAGNGRQVAAFDAGTGARRWSLPATGDCFTTSGDRVVCGRTVVDAASGAAVAGWPAGPYAPVGCYVAASGCGGVRDSAGHGWLTGAVTPERAAALDPPSATLAAGVVVESAGGAVVARSPVSGVPLWRWAGAATVLGGDAGRVFVLTDDRRLVALSARTGEDHSYGRMSAATESADWSPGGVQITGDFVVVERIGDPDPASAKHLFTIAPDAVAGVA
jgi:outer membrane protein assembly factor BamB